MGTGNTPYTGRFAPSPTGPLHAGSLVAALASFLDARHAGGHWLVRIEDIDPPREVPGATDAILDSLRVHGMHWDGEVLYQSSRAAGYDAALARLDAHGLLFRCSCTRAVLGPDGVCGGRCNPAPGDATALRVRTRGAALAPDLDLIRNEPLPQDLPEDFVVRRRDGLYAYQLAVVVDDMAQGISHVIRGNDLWSSTARQRFLFAALGGEEPRYGHFPLLLGEDGRKLSKQNHAEPIDDATPADNLRRALDFLRQPAPAKAQSASELLEHAARAWRRDLMQCV